MMRNGGVIYFTRKKSRDGDVFLVVKACVYVVWLRCRIAEKGMGWID
jgi:hypothetical protein